MSTGSVVPGRQWQADRFHSSSSTDQGHREGDLYSYIHLCISYRYTSYTWVCHWYPNACVYAHKLYSVHGTRHVNSHIATLEFCLTAFSKKQFFSKLYSINLLGTPKFILRKLNLWNLKKNIYEVVTKNRNT